MRKTMDENPQTEREKARAEDRAFTLADPRRSCWLRQGEGPRWHTGDSPQWTPRKTGVNHGAYSQAQVRERPQIVWVESPSFHRVVIRRTDSGETRTELGVKPRRRK